MYKNWLLPTAMALMPTTLAAKGETERPNIMIIMVDDMGYSDPQCFGGEVQTPNLNALAQDGVRFTQFFNCGRSCPSRGSLMTGLYAQECGITGMGVSLNKECVTIPEVLKTAGYTTAMSGKWHLSLTRAINGKNNSPEQLQWLSHQNYFDNAPFAPLDTYPCNRGFDEHWGTIWGVCDHFDPFSLVHNEEPIYVDGIPDGFYSTDFVTQKANDMLDELTKKDEPFFMYVAYTANTKGSMTKGGMCCANADIKGWLKWGWWIPNRHRMPPTHRDAHGRKRRTRRFNLPTWRCTPPWWIAWTKA